MSLNLDRSLRQELLRRRSKTDNEFNPSTSIKDNQPTIKRDGTMNTIKILVEAYGKSSYGDHRALAPHCQSILPQELASLDPQEWDHNNVNPDRNHDQSLAPYCYHHRFDGEDAANQHAQERAPRLRRPSRDADITRG